MLWWARPDGTGAPLFPEADVDLVVQHYDPVSGEPYWEDNVELFWVTNPRVKSFSVRSALVDRPFFVSVVPWIGDVPYRLQVTFPNSSTTVLDTGPIDADSPTQTWAYGNSGDLFIPSTGLWHSVLQYWPGSLNRGTSTSDVWANWDDYAFGRDAGTDGYILANEWVNLNYYPPVVSNATIAAR